MTGGKLDKEKENTIDSVEVRVWEDECSGRNLIEVGMEVGGIY